MAVAPPASKTCARAMNPDLKVQALELFLGHKTEDHFDDAFWSGLDGVCNALDNMKVSIISIDRSGFSAARRRESRGGQARGAERERGAAAREQRGQARGRGEGSIDENGALGRSVATPRNTRRPVLRRPSRYNCSPSHHHDGPS